MTPKSKALKKNKMDYKAKHNHTDVYLDIAS